MSNSSDRPQVFVVYGDASSFPESVTAQPVGETGHAFGHTAGPKSAQTIRSDNVSAQKSVLSSAYDPHKVHKEFPSRWMAYIRANFRNLNHVQQVFNVSERTARKWWKGETGANGGHVAIAVNEHPIAAQRMLFAAE